MNDNKPRRTVAGIVEWFLTHDLKMTSPVARKERGRLLGLLCDFRTSDGRVLGETPCEECIGADLVEFIDARFAGCSQWTRRRVCVTVKRPFNQACKLGLIPSNPFQGVSERQGQRGRDITWPEFRAMLRALPAPHRRILMLLLFSGCRPGELRKMQWQHIDFDVATVTLRDHKTAHHGHGPRVIRLNGVCLRLLAWLKKTSSAEWIRAEVRRIDLEIAARPRRRYGQLLGNSLMLHRLRLRRKRSMLLGVLKAPIPYVFLNSRGRQWTRQAICKMFRATRQRLGLPEDVSAYCCRHGFATQAIVNGVDISTLAILMGHNSIQSTQIYLHLADKGSHVKAAAERAIQFGGRKITIPAAQSDQQKLLDLLTAVLNQSKAAVA